MSALRIGVNALYLIPGGVGGTEIYLRGLLEAIASVDRINDYFIFRNRETGPSLTPARPNFHDCPQPLNAVFRPARIVYEQTVLPFAVQRHAIDVVLNAGFTAPLLCRCPMITVFHDLQYKHHPEFFRWFDLPFWRALLPLSAARSQRLVTLSEAVKRDLESFYRIDPSRIAVIPHGVEPEFARLAVRRLARPPTSKLLLTVSTLHPHKNMNALLKAFRAFLYSEPGWQLRVIGLKGFEASAIEALRRDLGLEQSVEIPGWLQRGEVYRSFADARALIYPSKFEGFGIPVLEALTAGVPTACSRLPSLLEIAGGSARFFDPESVDDIESAMRDVTLDEVLRARLQASGLVRAQAFSREASARKMIRLFEEMTQPSTRSKKSQD
ncbi:glycosyltransferase family 4 protein [Nevskia soli]|uniref:glycosyltransferase family 4 protein n=1 Tax=Nevskia soli TaxID=418856 RepID=UPI0015D7C13E|nr:glycosyltransferase family 1 protein [Nevskia soli]